MLRFFVLCLKVFYFTCSYFVDSFFDLVKFFIESKRKESVLYSFDDLFNLIFEIFYVDFSLCLYFYKHRED